MIRGSHFPAGLTWSTVRADCDFETYSEAGHVWNPNTNKWEGPPGAPKGKKGLEITGAANYASHESTEVLSFWYDLKDDSGRHFWRPGLPNPTPLLDYVKAGGVIEAWNVAFEWWIWNEVCTKKYGWPPLPIEQTYDAMAKARAHSLPGGLKKAAQVVQSAEQKDERGTDLLKYFSVPRNPTKSDPRRRIVPIWDEDQAGQWHEYLVACGVKPAQADKLILETRAKTTELSQYNEQDIIAEAAVSKVVPDLSPSEYRNWILDQRINRRGIGIDLDLVRGAISVINSASGDLGRQMWEICGCRPTEVAQILAWLHGKGVHLDSLDEDALDAALGTDLPEDCRTVLEIRGLLSSASVKKVFALNNTARAGRVHDLYVFHGAHTGRPTGSGAQPTNLPKAGPAVWQCEECGHHHWVEHGSACPYCSAPFDRTSKRREWSPEAADDAIRIAKTGSFELMRWFFSDALFALAGCLRGVFEAKHGHTFVSSDFSAIEGVVVAALANEEWRLEVFHGHGMIYELSAAKILGITLEEMLDYKKKNGQHHPARGKIGKVAELACFAPETQVLTHRGYLSIVDVTESDLLWDGIEWVSHGGVIPKGDRQTITLDGVEVTPQHPISLNGSWREAGLLASNPSMLAQALAHGSENLPLWVRPKEHESAACGSYAPAAQHRTSSHSQICSKGPALDATPVLKKKQQKQLRSSGLTKAFVRIRNTVAGCLTGFHHASNGVTTQKAKGTRTTEAEGYACTVSGELGRGNSFDICSPSPGGTAQNSNLTEPTLTAPTPQETCGSSQGQKTQGTSAALFPCSCASRSLRPVYDIAHAGPRNRFTIRTSSGHLIVHNSGFGGWINSWKAFGATQSDEEIKEALLAWRAASPAIVYLWGGQRISAELAKARGERRGIADPLRGWTDRELQWGREELFGLEGRAIEALRHPGYEKHVERLDGTPTGISYLYFGGTLYCRTLGGGTITYHNPTLSPAEQSWRGLSISYWGWNTNPKNGPIGWIKKGLYGGRMTENVVQKVARDIQMHAISNLEEAGYPVVMHTYDEDVCEVPVGATTVEEVEALMMDLPTWAKGWPIKAKGGWKDVRYRKG